jgi:hypothetical protein
MPRSTRSVFIACALGAALNLAVVGCVGGPTQTVFTGRFSADEPIRLTNQTITGGRYLVSYSMEVLLSPTTEPVTLICSVVDTSGSISGLNGMARPVAAGQWISLDVENVYELPDLTLGIRCVPESSALLTVVVRDVRLSAKQIR